MSAITLLNSDKTALLCDKGLAAIHADAHLVDVGFLDKLRLHSGGYIIFQRPIGRRADNLPSQVETIYLHRWLAKKLLPKPTGLKFPVVSFHNGDKTDCRVENLFWTDRSAVTIRQYERRKVSGAKYSTQPE